MKTTPQPDAAKMTPTVNTAIEAPEWSVVGRYVGQFDEHLDRMIVYQNGVEVANAIADEPTYIALAELTQKANSHARLLAENAALVKALPLAINAADCFKKAVRLLEESTGQYVNSASFYALSENLESARAALALHQSANKEGAAS